MVSINVRVYQAAAKYSMKSRRRGDYKLLIDHARLVLVPTGDLHEPDPVRLGLPVFLVTPPASGSGAAAGAASDVMVLARDGTLVVRREIWMPDEAPYRGLGIDK